MLQYENFRVQQRIEELRKEAQNQLKDYGKKFIGKNLQDCIPEIAKDFQTIGIHRGNVTFKTYHSRRTKKNKWEIEPHCHRYNTWDIHKRPILCKEFQGIIKDIAIDWCGLYDENGKLLGYGDTIQFILDNTEEFVIENRV